MKSIFKKLSVALALMICFSFAIFSLGCNQTYTVIVHPANSQVDFILEMKKGDEVTWETLYKAYPERFGSATGFFSDEHFFTDPECRNKFVGGVKSDIQLYFGSYSPMEYRRVVFAYAGKEYVIYRKAGEKLTAEDFTRSAYGYGKPEDFAFYSDKELTMPLDLQGVTIEISDSFKFYFYVADAK